MAENNSNSNETIPTNDNDVQHITIDQENRDADTIETEQAKDAAIPKEKKKHDDKIVAIKKSWIIEILKLQKQLLEASEIQKSQLERLQVLTKESQKSCRQDKFVIKKLCYMNKNLMKNNKLLHLQNKMLIKLKFKR